VLVKTGRQIFSDLTKSLFDDVEIIQQPLGGMQDGGFSLVEFFEITISGLEKSS
jgi:hypothetical protein